ncbi:MAG: M15 family metallopeptidase [Marinilabiliales bacterium]|nr:M15 family metallopeptidase [Marinilabiliales bacterium]
MKRLKLAIGIAATAFVLWLLIGVGLWVKVKINNWQKLSEIEDVDANSYRVFSKFIDDIEAQTDWSVEIISGLRSKEKQRELLKENAKNASVDKSRHVKGRAIDINLYKNNWLHRIWLKKFNSRRDWQNSGVVRISTKYNLLWGGSYRNYHDPVHFEIR